MGLFQKAVETYDAHRDFVGKEYEGHQILVPVSQFPRFSASINCFCVF